MKRLWKKLRFEFSRFEYMSFFSFLLLTRWFPIQFEKPFPDLPTMIDKKTFYREIELFRLTSGFKINVLKSTLKSTLNIKPYFTMH